jgi:hypothetical protein
LLDPRETLAVARTGWASPSPPMSDLKRDLARPRTCQGGCLDVHGRTGPVLALHIDRVRRRHKQWLLIAVGGQTRTAARVISTKPAESSTIRTVWSRSQRRRSRRHCSGSPCCSSHLNTCRLIGMLPINVIASMLE